MQGFHDFGVSFHMRKIWEHDKVFVRDAQDISTHEYL